MRLNRIALTLMLSLLAALPARAQQQDVRAFIYGNSLINHVSGSDETTMPHWLSVLAQAGGHGFAADGAFGAPLRFADKIRSAFSSSLMRLNSALLIAPASSKESAPFISTP